VLEHACVARLRLARRLAGWLAVHLPSHAGPGFASWLAGRPPASQPTGWLAVHLPSHGGGGWPAGWLVVHQPATAGRLAGWSSTNQPKGGEGGRFWDLLLFSFFFFNSWMFDSFRDPDVDLRKVMYCLRLQLGLCDST